MNVVHLVGRINNHIENLGEENKRKGYVILKVAISRINEKKVDIITIKLNKILGENATQFLHKGDLVAVKGRLRTDQRKMIVVGDSITYLSARKENE